MSFSPLSGDQEFSLRLDELLKFIKYLHAEFSKNAVTKLMRKTVSSLPLLIGFANTPSSLPLLIGFANTPSSWFAHTAVY